MLPNLQESVNSRADMSPLGSPLRSPGKSPGRSPKKGRLGHASTENEFSQTMDHHLASTDFGLPKIEEDVESHAGGIATYSVSKKKTVRTTSIENNGQVNTTVDVEEQHSNNHQQIGVHDLEEEEK